MDTTTIKTGFFDLLPNFFTEPQFFVVLFLMIIVLTVFSLYKNKNIKLSVFGKPIFDIEAKDVGKVNKVMVDKVSGTNVKVEGQVSSGEDSKKNNPGKKNGKSKPPAHSGCPYVNDFILVIRETTTVVSKISELKFKGCMSEQLYKADQHLMRFRSLYQKAYRKALKDLGVTDQDSVKSYKFYQLFIKVMLEDIKDEVIRAAFLNNHLAHFEMDKYIEYINNNFDSIKNVLDDGINDMYIGEWPLSQGKLMEIHHSIESESKEIIKEIFIDAREIAIRTLKRIQELESGLKEFVSSISGIDQ